MKLKQTITGLAAFACVSTAHAQSAGSFYVTTGWFHMAPQDSSEALRETSVGGSPVNITLPNTGASISDADTIGFTAGYFVTDHIATEIVLGVPPSFDLKGAGSFADYGKIGEAKQWSPTLLFKYYFNAAQAKFRPYLGLGVSRVWFTGERITNGAFQQNVLHGPTTVTTNSSWAPVFNAGFTYAFDQHWFAGLSISYLPLKVTAKLNSLANTPVGQLNVQSQTKITLNPIVTYLNLGYRF
ncbi:OmpW/AlkL family protein [Paraburkholderia hayleyella]|uniref:OmpW/AlkL family protein n=1 Tax=Paraburkholderia hayleyella TaxID=2152889 RepID=UPI001291B415|nr:OmpW family outer membrane protein [Paraburkholderia hayleyella]